MNKEITLQVLKDTYKKMTDLKEFNVPVILKTIEEYEKNGVDKLFINQQKAQLEKVNNRISELESKAARLLQELAGDNEY